jgi:hypothetical protein
VQIIKEVFEIFLERRNVNNEKTGLVAAVTVMDNALWKKSTRLGNPDPKIYGEEKIFGNPDAVGTDSRMLVEWSSRNQYIGAAE